VNAVPVASQLFWRWHASATKICFLIPPQSIRVDFAKCRWEPN
jgi:hypothetical protein